MDVRPTILVVDDEILLAEVACDIIDSAGMKAVFRRSIADALSYMAEHADSTVALFTDINLTSPMSGIELAVYVAEEWPHVAICVTSGISLDRPTRIPDKASFLTKPWRHEDILVFAETACGQPRAAG
ncbi:response regulator [Lichenihabitans psoromatis]|uniref:response regulator n=1 Tax=Lichenihabitans psoromatis TaxID=2528642 RepID=UPI0013F16784|nr:response regulator [Lichenihabitans psoromatis]